MVRTPAPPIGMDKRGINLGEQEVGPRRAVTRVAALGLEEMILQGHPRSLKSSLTKKNTLGLRHRDRMSFSKKDTSRRRNHGQAQRAPVRHHPPPRVNQRLTPPQVEV